jgi:hypothetical protein
MVYSKTTQMCLKAAQDGSVQYSVDSVCVLPQNIPRIKTFLGFD